jgi:hypothetical protein
MAGGKRLDHAFSAFGRTEVVKEDRPAANGLFVEGVLDVDHQSAGRAHSRTDAVDMGHDLARGADFGHLAGRHETVLQVNHHVGGSMTLQMLEHDQATASLGGSLNDIV